jgi:caffeoyl-CoA O-methyltransferase
MAIVSKEIEAYAARHCTAESALFTELVKVTHAKTEYPQMQVGRIEGAFLRLLTSAVRAKRVLEVGTFTGYSTLCFAEALPEDGQVITCDINLETTGIAREHWSKSPHGKKIELKIGPAADTIPKLSGEFDVAFIDADKENYPVYWDLIAPKIRSGGLIIIDNVLWSGSVLDAEPDEETRAIMTASKMAAEDPRFLTAMLSVRDGMLLACKN